VAGECASCNPIVLPPFLARFVHTRTPPFSNALKLAHTPGTPAIYPKIYFRYIPLVTKLSFSSCAKSLTPLNGVCIDIWRHSIDTIRSVKSSKWDRSLSFQLIAYCGPSSHILWRTFIHVSANLCQELKIGLLSAHVAFFAGSLRLTRCML
jgi:hypothetical protein